MKKYESILKSKVQTKDSKSKLHPRNRNRKRYDLKALIEVTPELENYLKPNKLGEDSVDFSNPTAVKLLNKALLKHYYNIKYWEFPDNHLTPPIPGRADYIHRMADLLAEKNFGKIPTGDKVICFDIGVGASCIYPILGITEYDWNFIGSDIDKESIGSANQIIYNNDTLKEKIDLRLQKNSKDVIFGIIKEDEKFDLTICNPPFHSSTEEATKGTRRKIRNLTGKTSKNPMLNFAGVSNELVCDGGENKFIQNLVRESKKHSKNCFWYSTLVSKQSNLKGIYKVLDKVEAEVVRTIPMGTGNKSTRIVAWTFLTSAEQKEWVKERWKKQCD
ncbi:23S rRNA m(6)A-1618 methyltransferase [Balneicella halophila]|uniref:Ribosomal RNA large subunit methyltransferase F n=1 Tax=Balneicella halophila TaxID=1537566 RepID=A0A7L4UPW4_BALHA|nr:23S rRNA (adenine(1618)-N(6))-methyltransferase RlmF [Balneicella halophila]PVX51818.1 23S rRNA m(6)A-1618 methyltransferase [Balneicella halophila]